MAVSKSTPSTKRLVISGKEVAFYWYKTMRNYYFFKKPSLLHAHACKERILLNVTFIKVVP